MKELKIRASREFMSDGVEIYIREGAYYCVDLVMEEREPGSKLAPSMTIRSTVAQMLMNDLWSSGIRPTEGAGSSGALLATQKHLEDMRTLVFQAREGLLHVGESHKQK